MFHIPRADSSPSEVSAMVISVNRIVDNVMDSFDVHSESCTKEQHRKIADTLKAVFHGMYEIREFYGRIGLYKVDNGRCALLITLYADL